MIEIDSLLNDQVSASYTEDDAIRALMGEDVTASREAAMVFALGLRARGASLTEIAQTLGITEPDVYDLLNKAIARVALGNI
ncbi:MAG: hypothetical protein ACPG4X_15895 [Pikeienuella sp.]